MTSGISSHSAREAGGGAKYIYHSPEASIQEFQDALEADGTRLRRIQSIEGAFQGENDLHVLLLDASLATGEGLKHLEAEAGKGCFFSIVLLSSDEQDIPLAPSLKPYVAGVLQPPLSRTAVDFAVAGALSHAAARRAASLEQHQRNIISRNLDDLTNIGIALSAEKNHSRLLDMILAKSRELTNSDAGSLYLVEENDDGEKHLRFMHTQNDSKSIPFKEFVMPATKQSISGYVAVTGETLNIPDVYQLPEGVEYGFNKTFDQSVGYRSKSMLVVPMRDHNNEITGVLQLINAKRSPEVRLTEPEIAEKEVIPFDSALEGIISALASQAAVSLENSMLLESLERTFEGFVKASVHAIEQRDPITSGHSERVTELTCALAKAVNDSKEGRYADVTYTEEQMKELRYAGLLHDFGKIGVREQVLQKSHKLYPLELDLVKHRFAFIKRTLESEYQRKMLELQKIDDEERVKSLEAELKSRLEEADTQLKLILEADVPTMMPDGSFDELRKLGSITYKDLEGNEHPYLEPAELDCLSIRRGNLSNEERKEIESHVTHSYNFLVQIPWTKDLRGIPEIAHGHHEKLNGQGYPRGLKEEEITLQAKMMCVCDIFDALTATDRPYKKAAPLERAVQILRFEVKDNHLDPELVDLFVNHKVYQAVEQFKNVEYQENTES